MLKVTTINSYALEYGVLDRYIEQVLDLPEYSIVREEECSNNSVLEFTVENKELDEHSWQDIRKLISSKTRPSYGMTGTIMNYLCYMGYIPSGIYMVRIYW